MEERHAGRGGGGPVLELKNKETGDGYKNYNICTQWKNVIM